MRKVEVLCAAQSAWLPILNDFFQDWPCHINFRHSANEIRPDADLILLETVLVTLPLGQKIKAQKQLDPQLRVIALGGKSEEKSGFWDADVSLSSDVIAFTKTVVSVLPTPSSIKLLIADDDRDILAMTGDFFEGRHAPSFEVSRAANGSEAWEMIQAKKPDVVILDIKMPVMDGREVYIRLKKQYPGIPVIIFYDAISSGDLNAVKKTGNPVVVEKGYRESSMPHLMALAKKLMYFSSAEGNL